MLLLWDELNVLHAKKKQVYGPKIPYVGFNVDPNVMSISLSAEHRAELITKVQDFERVGAGHISWFIPVWPLLHPCLSAMYVKIVGKTEWLAAV